MLDTMTLTKTVGAFCGALLVFLLGGWASTLIYGMGGEEGAHAEAAKQGYVIDTGAENKPAESEKKKEVTLASLWADADPKKGAKIFAKCRACHKDEEGANAVGPYLYGVVGRKVDSAKGYSYSGALEKVVKVWTPEHIFHFIKNPKEYAPGTKMGFAGLSDPKDRANVIKYLDSLDGNLHDVAAPAGDSAAASSDQASTDQAAESGDQAAASTDQAAASGDQGNAAASSGGGNDFASMVASADVDHGKKVFNKCRACHKIAEGQNAVGPSLYGVVGRDVATEAGFSYSDALKSVGGKWTEDKLNEWLTNPAKFAPGTKMGFPGLKSEEDRAAVVAYLESVPN